MVYEGISYLEVPGNLALMLNIDWFQPFDHTKYSIGVIYLVIQNLPRSMQFRPENIIVSTIPGPKEPSCDDLNPYLTCLVNDLLRLWNGIQMQTPSSVLKTRLVRAVLLYISSDIPATRKLCGFYDIKVVHGCSQCLKCFPSIALQTNYSGFDKSTWQPRRATHLEQTKHSNAATTRSSREEIEQKYSICYSELLKLPYFDVVRYSSRPNA